MMAGDFEVRQLPLSLPSCRRQVESFLALHGLVREEMEYYVGIFAGDTMLAGGGYQGNVIKCVAALEEARGLGLINRVVTHLRTCLREQGNLFVFTKPENREIFESLSFYTIGMAEKAILLESDKRGVERFCQTARQPGAAPRGAVVMNCNPFTLGHRYLVEQAAARCGHLYVFVVEEDRSAFPFSVRLELVRQGLADLEQVTVCPGGSYMISAATFPTYFLKSRSDAVQTHAALDADIFARQLAPRLEITARFVGQEPGDPVTALYNRALEQRLPQSGVSVNILPRLSVEGQVISASRVRALAKEGRIEALRPLVPHTTYEYIRLHAGELRL